MSQSQSLSVSSLRSPDWSNPAGDHLNLTVNKNQHQYLQKAINYIFGVISDQVLLSLLQQTVQTLQGYHGPLLALCPHGVVDEADGLVEGEGGEHGLENCLADPPHLLVVAGAEEDQLPVDGGGDVREPGEALTV